MIPKPVSKEEIARILALHEESKTIADEDYFVYVGCGIEVEYESIRVHVGMLRCADPFSPLFFFNLLNLFQWCLYRLSRARSRVSAAKW